MDSLYGIVMRIVAMVLALTPYGVLALIAHIMATSDYAAVLDLGKFVAVSYGALAFMFLVHCLVLLANRVSPLAYVRKAFPVLSFAFVARSSAGAVPLNIETQTRALGVDEATANFAASFGMSIGQNGCAGIYPAMLATIIAPTVGIDVFSPTFVAGLVAVVVISSLGVAGVGGGATFASLIVLGTMGLPIEIVGLAGLGGAAHRHGSHRAQRERLHGGRRHRVERGGRPRPRRAARPRGARERRGTCGDVGDVGDVGDCPRFPPDCRIWQEYRGRAQRSSRRKIRTGIMAAKEPLASSKSPESLP